METFAKKFPELAPFEDQLRLRLQKYEKARASLVQKYGSLVNASRMHSFYGFHREGDRRVYREWAPGAEGVYLAGDFNGWNWTSHPLSRRENGTWEISLPDHVLCPGSRVITIVKNGDSLSQHLPLFARYCVQDTTTWSWCCIVTEEAEYPWTDAGFSCKEPPVIYEAHVGMSSEEPVIASYRFFADEILPHVKKSGYNTVQLMGILEHPYYASFGYQVSNFFAPSSRFGSPEDLKYLINKAHSMGLRVLLDVVHSHAATNTLEGINRFDGTDTQFFHDGSRGYHPAWGTRCFDYGKEEVLRFLLSDLSYWLTEFHFDGFRFDGVTSMLYLDHGMNVSFTDLSQYFTPNTDLDAVTYLTLANRLVHTLCPHAITVSEDMSGMPGMCEAVSRGGLGFDYRLGMGLPDLWIRWCKETADEDWDLGLLWKELTFRNAPTIAYCESHDQALVGDQTLIFRLAGAEMYTQMDKICHTAIIDRAIALHKCIRLVTYAAGGTGLLTFMGNEFGHPEWIDFPTERNGGSYQYCRRQWSLLHNGYLKYGQLAEFDKAALQLLTKSHALTEEYPYLHLLSKEDHVLAFSRGGLLFVFNLHPTRSFADYVIPVQTPRDYRVILSSDDEVFGGFGRVAHSRHSAFLPGKEGNFLRLYLPSRTCTVLKPIRKRQASQQNNAKSL